MLIHTLLQLTTFSLQFWWPSWFVLCQPNFCIGHIINQVFMRWYIPVRLSSLCETDYQASVACVVKLKRIYCTVYTWSVLSTLSLLQTLHQKFLRLHLTLLFNDPIVHRKFIKVHVHSWIYDPVTCRQPAEPAVEETGGRLIKCLNPCLLVQPLKKD